MFQRQQMQSLCYHKDTQQDRVVYEAVLSTTAQVHPVARGSFRQVSSTTFTLAASIEYDNESNNKHGQCISKY
jgi:phage tail tube protein FII